MGPLVALFDAKACLVIVPCGRFPSDQNIVSTREGIYRDCHAALPPLRYEPILIIMDTAWCRKMSCFVVRRNPKELQQNRSRIAVRTLVTWLFGIEHEGCKLAHLHGLSMSGCQMQCHVENLDDRIRAPFCSATAASSRKAPRGIAFARCFANREQPDRRRS